MSTFDPDTVFAALADPTRREVLTRLLAQGPTSASALAPQFDFFVAGLSLHVSADAIYQGDQYTDVDLDPATYVPSYWKFAARVRLGRPDERWAITLGGNNLTDERVLNQVMDAVLFPASYYAVQAPGRSATGHSGSPVSRSSRKRWPTLVACATAATRRPSFHTSISAGCAGTS